MDHDLAADMWAGATSEEDGFPLILRFRQHVPARCQFKKFSTLVNICWRYDGSDSNGMPSPDDMKSHGEFEEAFAPIDEQDGLGFLMLVLTGNSRKEWVFYTADIEIWLERFNELLTDQPVYPIEIETSKDPGWLAWREIAQGAQL